MQYLDVDLLRPHKDNPRKIKAREVEKLCESIKSNPEYFEARPIICDANYIIWAGNSRYKAAKQLGLTQVPVHIIDLPEEKMREIMIRDNVNNGEWDVDVLANGWTFEELTDFGLNVDHGWGVADQGDDELPADIGKAGKKTKAKKIITCPHCSKDIEI